MIKRENDIHSKIYLHPNYIYYSNFDSFNYFVVYRKKTSHKNDEKKKRRKKFLYKKSQKN